MKHEWPLGVRESAYRLDAPRQTVSLTLNADLFAKAKAVGINVSRVAEEALARELDRRRRADIEAEVRSSLAAIDAYEKEHGSFVEQMHAAYGIWPGLEDK